MELFVWGRSLGVCRDEMKGPASMHPCDATAVLAMCCSHLLQIPVNTHSKLHIYTHTHCMDIHIMQKHQMRSNPYLFHNRFHNKKCSSCMKTCTFPSTHLTHRHIQDSHYSCWVKNKYLLTGGERAATACPIRLANGSIHHGALLSSSPGTTPRPNWACYSLLTSDFPQPPSDWGFSSPTMGRET